VQFDPGCANATEAKIGSDRPDIKLESPHRFGCEGNTYEETYQLKTAIYRVNAVAIITSIPYVALRQFEMV